MPGLRNKLTVASVKALTTPGRHADGAGLYLQVTKHAIMGNVRKSWVVRYRAANGKIREMGVGSAEDVTLADARDRATTIRKDVKEGSDAVEARIETKLETVRVRAASMTFAQCAEAYVKAHESGWKNDKHKAQWTATLKTYAHLIFGKVAVQDINVGMVMKVLDPIWQTKTETASRLRGRLEE
jgi:Arm DNA-binding domain